jgi:hypothetical protein
MLLHELRVGKCVRKFYCLHIVNLFEINKALDQKYLEFDIRDTCDYHLFMLVILLCM